MSGFEGAWQPIAGQVVAMCRAQACGRDADELYQRVMIRAWRGHDGFRGDSAYLTWVRQIIIREAGRLAAAREAEVRRRVALEPAWTEGPDLAADSEPRESVDGAAVPWIAGAARIAGPGGGLPGVIDQAARTGALSAAEHAVLTARLQYPDATWEQLAGRLGLTTTACAVTHCRAVPKLRVFLFLHRPGVLGGRAAIKAAFEQSGGLLTVVEAEAFRFLVIEGRHDYRRRGWQTALRGGCATVAGQLARG
ncbi:MAG TPA: sigma factor [Trebonia sp.]|nr:sigma factor [Trebonia sp.]